MKKIFLTDAIILPDLNPAIEVGSVIEFRCPPGSMFVSHPFNAPRIPVTCGNDGQFTKPPQWGAPDDWPQCVYRKISPSSKPCRWINIICNILLQLPPQQSNVQRVDVPVSI